MKRLRRLPFFPSSEALDARLRRGVFAPGLFAGVVLGWSPLASAQTPAQGPTPPATSAASAPSAPAAATSAPVTSAPVPALSPAPPATSPATAPSPSGTAAQPQGAPASGRSLEIEEVLRLTQASHPALQAARAHANAANEQRSVALGRLLPTITVSDEYQHWNSPFNIVFGDAVLTPRNENTNAFTVSADQPLLGLLRHVQDYSGRARAAEARDAQTRIAEDNLRDAVQEQYLRLFEARAMQQIAKASQAELAQQVAATQVKVTAGTLTKADLLRVQVALSNARQQEIVATTAQTIARANLLSAIGMPPDAASIEFREPTRLLEQGRQAPTATAGMSEQRPEILQARLDAEVAHHEERSSFYAMLPDVDLEGAYQRIDGQIFAPKNAAFVGVRASWPIWEWGSSLAAHRAAQDEEAAAYSNVESQRRQVQVEVTARRAQLDAADHAVHLAQDTVASAEEAYRVTDAVVRVGSGTTTDLLDAQSSLTQARLSLTHSEYERALAYVQLERASGATDAAAAR